MASNHEDLTIRIPPIFVVAVAGMEEEDDDDTPAAAPAATAKLYFAPCA